MERADVRRCHWELEKSRLSFSLMRWFSNLWPMLLLLLWLSVIATVTTIADEGDSLEQRPPEYWVAKLADFLQEPTDMKTNRTFLDILQQDRNNRKVCFEPEIYSSQRMEDRGKSDQMSIFNIGELKKHREFHLFVLANKSSVVVVRTPNKYFYWEFGQNAGALVIFVMIVVGNLSILHRLKSRRRRRSNVNYFIVHLAIADLFVGIFNVTLDAVMRYCKVFVWGLFACRVSKYVPVLFIYSSTNLLVALSIDRWEAVVKPLAFTKNQSHGYQLVAGAWLLAAISATPVIMFSQIKVIDGVRQCWLDLDSLGWKLYTIYITATVLVIPALIIAVFYIHIVYTIWRKAKLVASQQEQHEKPIRLRQFRDDELGSAEPQARPMWHREEDTIINRDRTVNRSISSQSSSDSETNFVQQYHNYQEQRQRAQVEFNQVDDELRTEGSYNTRPLEVDSQETRKGLEVGKNSTESSRDLQLVSSIAIAIKPAGHKYLAAQQHGKGVIPKARIKTIKMTLVIVAAYVLCWSPFCIINICVVFGFMRKDTDVTIALATLSQSLAHLNSAVNPIIFWLFSSKSQQQTTKTHHKGRPSICQRVLALLKQTVLCHSCWCCWRSDVGFISTDSKMFDATDVQRTSTTETERRIQCR